MPPKIVKQLHPTANFPVKIPPKPAAKQQQDDQLPAAPPRRAPKAAVKIPAAAIGAAAAGAPIPPQNEAGDLAKKKKNAVAAAEPKPKAKNNNNHSTAPPQKQDRGAVKMMPRQEGDAAARTVAGDEEFQRLLALSVPSNTAPFLPTVPTARQCVLDFIGARQQLTGTTPASGDDVDQIERSSGGNIMGSSRSLKKQKKLSLAETLLHSFRAHVAANSAGGVIIAASRRRLLSATDNSILNDDSIDESQQQQQQQGKEGVDAHVEDHPCSMTVAKFSNVKLRSRVEWEDVCGIGALIHFLEQRSKNNNNNGTQENMSDRHSLDDGANTETTAGADAAASTRNENDDNHEAGVILDDEEYFAGRLLAALRIRISHSASRSLQLVVRPLTGKVLCCNIDGDKSRAVAATERDKKEKLLAAATAAAAVAAAAAALKAERAAKQEKLKKDTAAAASAPPVQQEQDPLAALLQSVPRDSSSLGAALTKGASPMENLLLYCMSRMPSGRRSLTTNSGATHF